MVFLYHDNKYGRRDLMYKGNKGAIGTPTSLQKVVPTDYASEPQEKYVKRASKVNYACKQCDFNDKGFCRNKLKWCSNVNTCEKF